MCQVFTFGHRQALYLPSLAGSVPRVAVRSEGCRVLPPSLSALPPLRLACFAPASYVVHAVCLRQTARSWSLCVSLGLLGLAAVRVYWTMLSSCCISSSVCCVCLLDCMVGLLRLCLCLCLLDYVAWLLAVTPGGRCGLASRGGEPGASTVKSQAGWRHRVK